LSRRNKRVPWEIQLNEQELVRNARSGDNNAFKKIVKKYENQVAATVIGMLGYCPEAEDVGQETFIRFYKALPKFRGESSVGTYLTRIAINLSLNEIKRRKRLRNRFVENPEERIGNYPDSSHFLKQNERKEMVQKAVQKLEPKFRSAVVLRFLDGYTSQETAKILKLPIGTVLSRLARAQMKLKDILAPSLGGLK
jgi:RNA polymerase sigma-70 factor (ECF subfamily)